MHTGDDDSSDRHVSDPDAFEDRTATVAGDGFSGLGVVASDEPQAYLIVLAGSRVGEMLRVDEHLIVGRGMEADLRVDDAGASKRHAEIAQGPAGVFVRDLGSRNGTFVNGEQIRASRRLQDGDKIHFGSTTILKFSFADELDESFQRQMFDAALRDGLTGLYNRRYLEDQLEVEVSYAVRHVIPMSLVLFDVDHFKKVNDTLGHPVGDAVLRGVARQLSGAIRREDLAARYGGEEFALVCRATPSDVATMVADRIRGTIENALLVEGYPDLRVTVSGGVASIPGSADLRDAQELLRAADQALYAAKDGGRNRVCRHGDGDDDEGGEG